MRRVRRLSRAHLLAAVLLGLLGFSLVVQVRQTQSGNLAGLNQTELVQLLDSVNRQADLLDQDTRDLQRTAEQLRTGSDRALAAQTAAKQRLEVLGILAGTLAAQGPGITLQIEDPQGQLSAATLLDTVEELRDAGAEAIQIGTVRVVASTWFVDAGGSGGVQVDGVHLDAPYTFVAIGDPATMSSALNIPGGVLDTLQQSHARGTVRPATDLTVAALHAVTRPKYAVPNPGS